MGGNTLSYYNGNQFKGVYAKRFDHFFCVVLSGAVSPARAVILFGKGNATHIVDPGAGLPWANVVDFRNGSGTSYGSGVYLDNQFVLTAAHIDQSVGSQIKIEGQTFYVDTSFNTGGYVNSTQKVGTADLRLVRLTMDPAQTVSGLTTINLNSNIRNLNRNSVFVGFGEG